MIKIRVFWESDDEIETAQAVTNSIDSILEGKQVQLGIKRLGIRTTNDPLHSFGINVEKRTKPVSDAEIAEIEAEVMVNSAKRKGLWERLTNKPWQTDTNPLDPSCFFWKHGICRTCCGCID